MKQLFIFIVIVSVTFSCTKNEDFKESDSTQIRDIGFVGIDEGEIHNELTKHLVKKLTPKHPENKLVDEIYSNLIGADKTIAFLFGVDPSDLNNIISNIDKQEIAQFANNQKEPFYHNIHTLIVSQNLKDLMIEMSELRFNISEKVLDEIEPENSVRYLSSIYTNFYDNSLNRVNGNEKVLFGAFTDVMISSTELWSPREFGGEGLRDDLLKAYGIAQPRGRFRDWLMSKAAGKAVLSDATGMIAGAGGALASSGGAAALPLCGGIPCAGVAGVILGVGASVTSVINSGS